MNSIRLQLIDLLSGLTIRKAFNTISEQQYLAPEELDGIRQNKFLELFKKARQASAYFKKYVSYKELPVLTKNVMKEHPEDFINPAYKGKLVKKSTSGSTGTPFDYTTCTEAQSHLWAGLIMSWQVCGYRFGEKVAFVAGSSLVKKSIKHIVFYKLMNIDTYPVEVLTDDIIAGYLEKMKHSNTKVIYGYAMAINILADYILRTKTTPPPNIAGIVCTAEMLTENARENIEKAFGVKVYNQYGCNEAGISAFECEQGGLHLITSRCFYERADNGRLISTDLINQSSFFIKYDTTDLVDFAEEGCGCGRHYPIIKTVVGRSDDVITDMNNKKIHCAFFNFLFKNDTGISQYQVQYDDKSISLVLRAGENFLQDNTRKYLQEMKDNFCFTEYNVDLSASFYTGKNLKHTFTVDKRKMQEPVPG